MSRTIRCKNKYTWAPQGTPKGYSMRWYEAESAEARSEIRMDHGFVVLDPKTDSKLIGKLYWKRHCESNANNRSPGKSYRQARHRQHRQSSNIELYKFMNFVEYEPMINDEPVSCLCDWR